MGNPMGIPMRILMGNPMGIRMEIAMGSPIRVLIGFPVGNLVGTPMGIPMGITAWPLEVPEFKAQELANCGWALATAAL